ncbi:MAG: hypothetical protein IT518_13630, partial [Burkholderiales bacterium]|nr:hypothetical protein [Burkholderiales bacterium]
MPDSNAVRRPARRAGFAVLALAWALSFAAAAAEPARKCVVSAPQRSSAPGASHELAISVNVFAGTRWAPDAVRGAVAESARLLAQCGIDLARIQMCVVDAPPRYRFYSTPVSRELLRKLPVAK